MIAQAAFGPMRRLIARATLQLGWNAGQPLLQSIPRRSYARQPADVLQNSHFGVLGKQNLAVRFILKDHPGYMGHPAAPDDTSTYSGDGTGWATPAPPR